MPRFATLLLFLTIAFSLPLAVLALDEEEIRKIAAKPHSRDSMIPELEIYPNAREYEIVVDTGPPGEPPTKSDPIIAKEKTVDGNYIVSTFTFPTMKEPTIMVVTYDRESMVYRKWVLMPDGNIGEMIGTGIPSIQTISWMSADSKMVSIEHHEDDKTTWREVLMNEEGKPVFIITGEAKKTK